MFSIFLMVEARSFEVLHGTSTCIIWGSEPFYTFCWFKGSKIQEPRFRITPLGETFENLPFLDPVDPFFPLAQLITNDFWLVAWNIVFPCIGNVIIPTNWRSHIFQRGSYTTKQFSMTSRSWPCNSQSLEAPYRRPGRKLICNLSEMSWGHVVKNHRCPKFPLVGWFS